MHRNATALALNQSWRRLMIGTVASLAIFGAHQTAEAAGGKSLDIGFQFSARVTSFSGLSASLYVSNAPYRGPYFVNQFVVDGQNYAWVTLYYGHHRPYGAIYIQEPWGWQRYQTFYPGPNDYAFSIDFYGGGWGVNRQWHGPDGGWRYSSAYLGHGRPAAQFVGHAFLSGHRGAVVASHGFGAHVAAMRAFSGHAAVGGHQMAVHAGIHAGVHVSSHPAGRPSARPNSGGRPSAQGRPQAHPASGGGHPTGGGRPQGRPQGGRGGGNRPQAAGRGGGGGHPQGGRGGGGRPEGGRGR